MKPPEKKSINISSELHRAISYESVRTRKDRYVLMEEAWQLYEQKRDQPAGSNVVELTPSKRDPHSVTIHVPPEIAKDVQRIVDVLRAPGALEQFNLLMHAIAQDGIARSLAEAGGKKK